MVAKIDLFLETRKLCCKDKGIFVKIGIFWLKSVLLNIGRFPPALCGDFFSEFLIVLVTSDQVSAFW